MHIFSTHRSEYQKTLYLFNIPIYTRKREKNRVKFYLFRISIWKKIYDDGKVKHYFGGVRIGKFDSNKSLYNKDKSVPLYICLSKISFKMNQRHLNKNEKLKIHFLYIADSYWPSWESIYNACAKDENLDVKVIFLRTKGTHLYSSQYVEAEKFLKIRKIPYIEYQNYIPEEERPHVILYQTPYNVNYDVFNKLRPDFITGLGIRIVYISYGIEYDKSINNEHIQNLHYTHRVHSLAWRLFVMHSDIKDGFYKYCPAGGFHIVVSGHPKFDCYVNNKFSLPNTLLEKANGRKIIAFQIHCYNDSDCIGEKRIHSIPFAEHLKIQQILSSYKKYFFVYTIHPAFKTRNISRGFCTSKDYFNFIKKIKSSNNMCVYKGDHQTLLAEADAFITENSSLMIEMGFFNKSVLYMYDRPIALKPFAEKLVSTFHHGHSHKDVVNFIENIVFKHDDLLQKRALQRESIFPKSTYDGNIGLRIKQYIIKTVKEESSHL